MSFIPAKAYFGLHCKNPFKEFHTKNPTFHPHPTQPNHHIETTLIARFWDLRVIRALLADFQLGFCLLSVGGMLAVADFPFPPMHYSISPSSFLNVKRKFLLKQSASQSGFLLSFFRLAASQTGQNIWMKRGILLSLTHPASLSGFPSTCRKEVEKPDRIDHVHVSTACTSGLASHLQRWAETQRNQAVGTVHGKRKKTTW